MQKDVAPPTFSQRATGRKRQQEQITLWLCLLLFFLVLRNATVRRSREPKSFKSVSIPDNKFLWGYCSELTQLPYRPANSPVGRFRAHGLRGFVFVSSHRLSAVGFAVVGLTPASLRDVWGAFQEVCLWISFAGPRPISGAVEFHFSSGMDGSPYDVIVISCTLSHGTPQDAGGSLFLNIQGLDEVLVYREEPGRRDLNPPSPLPRHLTICMPPLTLGEVGQPERVLEYMQYAKFFGVDGFVLYNAGGMTRGFVRATAPFSGAGLLDIVDFEGLQGYLAAGTELAATDCVHRTRFTSEWVLLAAPDEYPTIQESHHLARVLRTHAGRPWLSLGVVVWDTTMCLHVEDGSLWPVERMVFRRKLPFCNSSDASVAPDICPGARGVRRVIADPRQVSIMDAHSVVVPQSHAGHDISTDVMRLNKYVGILEPAALFCEYPVTDAHSSPRWDKDYTIRKLIRQGKLSGNVALPTPRGPATA